MSKLNLLRNAIAYNSSFRNSNFNRGLPAFSRDSPRLFSTEAEPPQHRDSSPEPFLQTPPTGFVYGKLTSGINRHTLKTDIINYLEGSNLSLDDVKLDYNWNSFWPMGMVVQFPSRVAFDNALKVINKKGRLYKLERAQRSQWDSLTPYNGKAVLLQGIPRNALQEDIDRFLSGFDYDASAIQILLRPAFPDPIRMAIVPFPTAVQAMNAFITKNRGYCLNNQILVRVLQ